LVSALDRSAGAGAASGESATARTQVGEALRASAFRLPALCCGPMTAPKTRPAAIAPVAYIFQANDGLIRQTLSDLPAEALWKQLGGRGNSIMWIVGHITQTRAGMLSLLGERASTGWGELFRRGAQRQDPSAYPEPQAIKTVGVDLSKRLHAKLAAITEEELAIPVTTVKLPNVNTVVDALAFFAFHEAYHVGQLGYVKKALGYTPIAG
jgi:uncharacterized damage-inducible protein DinB